MQLDHQSLAQFLVQLVALVDDDQVCFFELLLVDVDDLRGKGSSFNQAQDARRPDRVDQHAQGGDSEAIAIEAPQRVAHGGEQVLVEGILEILQV